MKLRTKFLIQVIATVVSIFILVIFYLNYNYTRQTQRLSYKITDLYTQQLAQSIEAKLIGDMQIIEAMKEVFEFYAEKHKTLDENYVRSILEAVLRDNPDFLAVWISIELRFLDKNWFQFHGRKRIVAYLDKGQIKFSIDSVDIESENQESIYYKMKVGMYKELIMDPYFFSYSLEDTTSSYLETSLGKPVFYNNEFIGLVGIDVYLGKMQELIQIITPFEGSYAVLISTSGDIVAHPNDKALGKKILSVYPELRKFNVLDSISQAKPFSLILKNQTTNQWYLYSFYPVIPADKKLPWSLIYIVPINQILQNVRNNLTLSITISVISIIIVIILVTIFISRISNRIQKAREVLQLLSQGIIDEKAKLKVFGKDEIFDIYRAINDLIDSLKSTVIFAEEIGKGNLDAFYHLRSEHDQLGKALIEMKVNLKNIRKQEERRLQESEKLNWVQHGITEINEILRMQNENLDQLAFEVISFLVKYLKANQGGFYIIKQKDNQKKITLLVAYAYDRKKQLEAEFDIGEGLIGRAVKEKTIINITDLPQGYTYVTSGLGDQTPDNLIIVPLIFEDEVYGAIEILSFKKFDDYQKEFLTQAAYRIASTVSNIIKSQQTIELLERFREQSKIIDQKEKTLEKRIQELSILKQEVETLRKHYEQFFEVLGQSISIIHYNQDLIVTKVNKYLLELLNLEAADILGKKIDQLLPEAKENPKWFSRFIKDLKQGIVRKKITLYKLVMTRIVYLDETYIPIKKDDKVEEIICFGFDITKYQKK